MKLQFNLLKNKGYRNQYQEYIETYNKFNFFQNPLKSYVPAYCSTLYAAIACVFFILPLFFTSLSFGDILECTSYLLGMCCGIAAFIQYLAYKKRSDIFSPAQIITLIIVAVEFLSLPYMIEANSNAVFSSSSIEKKETQ